MVNLLKRGAEVILPRDILYKTRFRDPQSQLHQAPSLPPFCAFPGVETQNLGRCLGCRR